MSRISHFLALAFFLMAGAASASITSGYYYIKSNYYDGRYITENITSHELNTAAKGSSYAQVWYLRISNGNSVTIKNALTDRYVQSQTTTSAVYSTGTSSYNLTYSEGSGTVNFKNSSNSWGGLHCAATQSYKVVYWDNTADANKWVIEPATVDNAALAAEKDALKTATASQLTQFFTTTACTALKDTYASMNDNQLRQAMSSLPTSVQNMAIKVKNNAWTSYGTWRTDKYYRIADYKPYSNASQWSNILKFSYPLGHLNNPTGIWADAGDVLQVYVGDIPSGQSVGLEVVGKGEANGISYTLSKGMNALMVTTSGNCFINYEVNNTTNGNAPYTALSSYADVTIHIEGGTVKGYFDLTKGDTNDDYDRMAQYLMSKEAFVMKTKTLVFSAYRDDITYEGASWPGLRNAVATDPQTKIVETLTFWQDVQSLEDELCNRGSLGGNGTDDFAYCNNSHSVTMHEGMRNPYASTYGIFIHACTHFQLFTYESQLKINHDHIWCIAHELGHHRQGPINMVGMTEVSNNMFSNAAVYWQGRYTSRSASIQGVFDDYLNGVSWPERVHNANAGVGDYNQLCLKLYWQLYQFFHINGNDPDFFQQLFTALRNDPMTKTVGDDALTPASTDYLKFYVKCCEVSGYDLTDFFTAYGFFMLPPEQSQSITYNGVTTNLYQNITDYSHYNLYVTQSMIDAAKAQVAAMSNLKACNIIFIEDRVKAPLATYEGAAAGETKQLNPSSQLTAFGVAGDMGQYTDFDEPCSSYTYNVSERGNVTVEGTGAVGIVLKDSEGNIVGFYNTNTFSLPAEAFDANGLKSGYTLEACAGDGTTAEMSYDASVETSDFPKTGVSYVLFTPLRYGCFMLSNGAGQGVAGTATATPTDAMKWRFVLRDGESETFDIRNVNDGSYLSPTADYNTQVSTSATQPSQGWKIKTATEGLYIICSGSLQLNQTGRSATGGYAIYNWGGGDNTSDEGCQFCIAEASELSGTMLDELQGYELSGTPVAANDLEAGKWYVMFDRGANHGYLYEKASSHTLYNTATSPAGGSCTDADAKYLVRLIPSGVSGKYYIQTGLGNYFWQLNSGVNVATTPYPSQPITIDKINGTDGHFYLQSCHSGVVLDANALTYGDATVVGYGTTIPSSINGNNDWAFYPIDTDFSVSLNKVGDASYATLYLPHDVTLPENTKAFYITEVTNGYAQLTEMTEGIPAYTAAVLVNSEAATSATLPTASGLSSVVSKYDNLLKGTLVSMTLDLSDATDNYSLGRRDGVIGFYKFNNGGNTSITLGANKAYLKYADAGSGVKGFKLFFDDATGIVSSLGETEEGASIFNLAGQRMQKAQKGINIINGKKVLY